MSKTNKNFNAAIIVAGGKGLRLDEKIPKQFLLLGNKTVFLWSVIAFNKTKLFGQLIVVAPKNYHKKYAKLSKKYNFTFAPSGDERINSVISGLEKLNPEVKFVAIHDAARPFISPKLIAVIQIAAQKNGAAIAAIPAQDTVKYSKDGLGQVKPYLRANIWLAQTPQTFKRGLIETAYKKNKNFKITDDSSAIESIGIRPVLILGEKNNFKITTKEDMLLAKNNCGKKDYLMFAGIGYDAHRFKKNRKLVLGGHLISKTNGLDGHSDADVLVHAIMDALLGAAGLSDIGHYFPNTNKNIKGASSIELLLEVNRILKKEKFIVNNIDSTLICEAPKISPYIKNMKENIAKALNLRVNRVGLKATTNEKMGFVGRKEGVAAIATATIIVTNSNK